MTEGNVLTLSTIAEGRGTTIQLMEEYPLPRSRPGGGEGVSPSQVQVGGGRAGVPPSQIQVGAGEYPQLEQHSMY